MEISKNKDICFDPTWHQINLLYLQVVMILCCVNILSMLEAHGIRIVYLLENMRWMLGVLIL